MLSVMYHYVRPHSPPYHRLWYLPLDGFRRQLDWLTAEHGWAPQREAVDYLAGDGPDPGGAVLTFDDGLADHYHHVLPELVQRGLWAFFFVQTGQWLDGQALPVHRHHATGGGRGTPEQERALTHWYLSRWQARELERQGMVLGGHGTDHHRLTETCANNCWREIKGGLLREVFAYPHGAHDERTRERVRACGYRAAYAEGEQDHGPYARPRTDCRYLPHGESQRA